MTIRNRTIFKRDPNEPVRVKQSDAKACDINVLMRKYRNGGEINHINRAQGQYGDFSSGQDYTDSLTAITKAENAFAELPAYIRDQFGNNPEVFLYEMEKPEVQLAMSKLGVFDPEAGPILEEPKSVTALDTEPAPRDRSSKVPGPPQDSEAKLPQPAPKDRPAIQGGE